MNSIPKIIHYCWFGGKEKPILVKECIETWKVIMPDYEIIEWNETNFNVNSIMFTQQAYNQKKWAFVSDYCRIWALYNYGGIYLDTDMEVIKTLDVFLEDEAFAGVEGDGYINSAIWGCKKNDSFIKVLIEHYEQINFLQYKDDLFEIATPKIITRIATQKGYKGNQLPEKIYNGTIIYPKEFFYPKKHSWEKDIITNKTYTIHHYDGSWKSKRLKLLTKIKKILIKILGYEKSEKLVKLLKGKI